MVTANVLQVARDLMDPETNNAFSFGTAEQRVGTLANIIDTVMRGTRTAERETVAQLVEQFTHPDWEDFIGYRKKIAAEVRSGAMPKHMTMKKGFIDGDSHGG